MNNEVRERINNDQHEAPAAVVQRLKAEDEMGDDDNDLKVKINTFIWMHAPGHMTLAEAEDIALKMWSAFVSGRDLVNLRKFEI